MKGNTASVTMTLVLVWCLVYPIRSRYRAIQWWYRSEILWPDPTVKNKIACRSIDRYFFCDAIVMIVINTTKIKATVRHW